MRIKLKLVILLLLGMTIVGKSAIQIEASSPSGVMQAYWSQEDPGVLMYEFPQDGKTYEIKIDFYKGDKIIQRNGDTTSNAYSLNHIDYRTQIENSGSGEYRAEVAYAEIIGGVEYPLVSFNLPYVYVEPLDSLEDSMISIDENGQISWNEVSGSRDYSVNFIDSNGTETSLYYVVEEPNISPSRYLNSLEQNVRYNIQIRANTTNIEEKKSSQTISTNDFMLSELNILASDVIESIFPFMHQYNSAEITIWIEYLRATISSHDDFLLLANTMQLDNGIRGYVTLIENQYQVKNSIKLDKLVGSNSGFTAEDISLVGAFINAESNSQVSFSIDRVNEVDELLLDANLYTNSIEYKIDFSLNGVEQIGLKMPITITIPIPNNIDSNKLVVLSNQKDGCETKLFEVKHDGTVQFTITDLENIILAQEVEVPVVGFDDVIPGGWEYEPIVYAYNNNLMSGTGTDASGNVVFNPNGVLTREQFAQILYNAEGKPAVTFTNRFSDVPDGQWYSSAIIWAAENNIVSGYNNGKYGVGDVITREQLAVMLYKYAQLKGKSTVGVPTTALDAFGDKAQVSDWASTQIQWAVHNKVMSGTGVNLEPKGQATRAACAAMLRNYFEGVGK